MAETWKQIARDSLSAAGELLRNRRYRSSVSRAYYAVFAMLTHELEQSGTRFATNRSAPSHAGLVRLVEARLSRLDPWTRRQVKRMARQLYAWRCDADYVPGIVIGHKEARKAFELASRSFERLEQFE